MARMTAPNGTVVSVDDGQVGALLARGFTVVEPKKAPAKKSAGKSSK